MGQKNEPYYGEDTDHDPHMGEREEPKGPAKKDTAKKDMSTGTTASNETGTDTDDAEKAGMRPTGSGGSAPPPQNR